MYNEKAQRVKFLTMSCVGSGDDEFVPPTEPDPMAPSDPSHVGGIGHGAFDEDSASFSPRSIPE